MPNTMRAAEPFRVAVSILMLTLRGLLAGVVADIHDHLAVIVLDPFVREATRIRRRVLVRAEHARRWIAGAVYIPTRQEAMTFGLMFSLGANLVTVLAVMAHA